jgi:hypothetical protein
MSEEIELDPVDDEEPVEGGNDDDERLDDEAEEDAFTKEPESKTDKKQKNPKLQRFFHTINKHKDSTDTDEEFIAETQSKLRDEWCLRFTKGQTLMGLSHMSWVVEWGTEEHNCHFHVLYKFERDHRRTKNAMFKFLQKRWKFVHAERLIVWDPIRAWKYINKLDSGSLPVVVLGGSLVADGGGRSNVDKQTCLERLNYLVREEGIRNEAKLVELEPRLIGRQKDIRHLLKVTKYFRPTYSDCIYLWQAFVVAYLFAMEGDQRTYLHLYDLHGNAGKTWFSAVLKTYYGSKCCVIDAAGQYGDMVDSHRAELEESEVIIIDASRSENNARSISKLVEHILNGRVPATKYEADSIQSDAAFVILLSNDPPCPGRLSLDRTICIQLEGGGDSPFRLLTTREWVLAHNEVIAKDKSDPGWFFFEDYYKEPEHLGPRGPGTLHTYMSLKKVKIGSTHPQACKIDPVTGWHANTKDWIKEHMSWEAFMRWIEDNPDEYQSIRTKFVDPCRDCEWNMTPQKKDEHNGLGFSAGMDAKRKRAHLDVKKLRKDHVRALELRQAETDAADALDRMEEVLAPVVSSQ